MDTQPRKIFLLTGRRAKVAVGTTSMVESFLAYFLIKLAHFAMTTVYSRLPRKRKTLPGYTFQIKMG